jgi:hypothetical protein
MDAGTDDHDHDHRRLPDPRQEQGTADGTKVKTKVDENWTK